jgi:hypothetical protein
MGDSFRAFHALTCFLHKLCPGAYAPGFTLAPASQAKGKNLLFQLTRRMVARTSIKASGPHVK